MAMSEDNQKVQKKKTPSFQEVSFRLYQPEELESMEHSDLVALFLEHQEQLREAACVLAEQDRMITCLLEEKNLDHAEKYGSSSETSASLRRNTNTGKASNPSSGDDGADHKEKKRKQKPKRGEGCIDAIMKDLPVHRRDIRLTREELLEKYGTDQVKEGPEKIYRTCRFIPGIWYVEEVHVHTVKDPHSGAIFQPIKASGFKFRPGSYLSAELLAYVLDQRFTMAVPYYRMQKWLERNHFYLKRETLAAWVLHYDTELFAPLVCRLWHHLLLADRIQIDETPSIVQEVRRRDHAPSSLCYMWDFRTSELLVSLPEVVLFHFDESRGTEVLEECLPGFSGTISSDGHSPYHGYAEKSGGDIRNAGCLNHARTRFAKVLRANPSFKKLSEEERKEIPACRIIEMFQKIFQEDAKLKEVSPQERLEKRQKTVKPLFEELSGYIHSFGPGDFVGGGLMEKALNYFKNQQPYLEGFLSDPFVPNNNSACERDHAGYAILRNNIKFIDSIDGAVATADLYSLAATAKAHGADFYTYILYILKKLPRVLEGQEGKDFRNMEALDAFMPWSAEYRKYEQEEWELRKKILEEETLFPTEDNRVSAYHQQTGISDKIRQDPESTATEQDISCAS